MRNGVLARVPIGRRQLVFALLGTLAAVRQTGATSDAQATAMVTGAKTNIVDVVTAVAETETTINTLVSVRDKVVAAYEQIMQMPI